MMTKDQHKDANKIRKARTRTLIQLGALVKLSGLLEQCEIVEGEDLQMNFQGQDKAAILLGLLLSVQEKINAKDFEGEKNNLKNKGILKLKERKKI